MPLTEPRPPEPSSAPQPGAKADDRYFGHEHVTVIRPTRGWGAFDLRELWAYRELLWVLTERDIRVRYKQAALGIAWALIQPVLLMVVVSVFFGFLVKVPSDGAPYPIFVYAALVPWTFFSSALSNSAGALITSANLITKVYFPRLIVPLASAGSWLVDLVIASLILLAMMLYYGFGWSWNLLALPGLVFVMLLTALGVGTMVSALSVKYRDLRIAVPFLLQFWMFATPVVYPMSMVPQDWQWVLHLNPIAGVIEGFRAAVLGRPLDYLTIAGSLVIALILFVAGVAYFSKVERKFADVI